MACRFGDAPRSVARLDELPADTLWLTNLDEGVLQLRGAAFPGIKPLHFLGISLDVLLDEFGYTTPLQPDTAAAAAADIAEVGNRVLRLVHERYGLPSLRVHTPGTLPSILGQHLLGRSVFVTVISNSADAAVFAALNSAFLTTRRTGYPGDLRVRPYRLRFARTSHAAQLLSYPAPWMGGYWQPYPEDFPKRMQPAGDGTDLFRFLADLGSVRSALVRLRIGTFSNPGYAHALDPLTPDVVREWFPVHEALFLAARAGVQLLEVLVGPEYTYLQDQPDGVPPDMSHELGVSYSHGLVAHLHWLALAAPVLAQPNPYAPPRRQATPLGVWLASWNRLRYLQAAEQLHQATGAFVASCGTDGIEVMLQPEQLVAVQDACPALHLIPTPRLHRDAQLLKEFA
ncbi:MAG: hypothetical protein CVV05_00710 [Gammaproteobacteria bacterium HGW-Gammaproteobacteria-1]|nr:MAG: hypothetical protein CVV05_00710 [Gammaproteobacteria bacterium HGW-Gammaproteobacteria-1]